MQKQWRETTKNRIAMIGDLQTDWQTRNVSDDADVHFLLVSRSQKLQRSCQRREIKCRISVNNLNVCKQWRNPPKLLCTVCQLTVTHAHTQAFRWDLGSDAGSRRRDSRVGLFTAAQVTAVQPHVSTSTTSAFYSCRVAPSTLSTCLMFNFMESSGPNVFRLTTGFCCRHCTLNFIRIFFLKTSYRVFLRFTTSVKLFFYWNDTTHSACCQMLKARSDEANGPLIWNG